MSVLHGIRSVSCILAVACAAAQAEPDLRAAPRLEIESLQPWDAARRDSLPGWRPQGVVALSLQRLVPADAARPGLTDNGLRARWWWGRGAIEVGAGADWLAPSSAVYGSRPVSQVSQVVGVRAALSARTRLVYETENVPAWRNAETGGVSPRTERVALEFKSRSPAGDLRNGLMRVQLSGDSALHFKPRGGGLQVTYRERF